MTGYKKMKFPYKKKKMKTIIQLFLALLIPLSVSAQIKNLPVKNAEIQWKGYKMVGSSHEGTINLKKGVLVLQGKEVKGGKFIVDMTSINSTDVEGKSKEGLDAHLKNEDFFDVEKYPEAILEFKRIGKNKNGSYKITADLTIKGITQPVVFSLFAQSGKAKAQLEIDRSKHGVTYGSSSFFEGLGDRVISDNFDIIISFQY